MHYDYVADYETSKTQARLMQALISGASQDVCVQHNASNALNALEMICEIGLNTRTEKNIVCLK